MLPYEFLSSSRLQLLGDTYKEFVGIYVEHSLVTLVVTGFTRLDECSAGNRMLWQLSGTVTSRRCIACRFHHRFSFVTFDLWGHMHRPQLAGAKGRSEVCGAPVDKLLFPCVLFIGWQSWADVRIDKLCDEGHMCALAALPRARDMHSPSHRIIHRRVKLQENLTISFQVIRKFCYPKMRK